VECFALRLLAVFIVLRQWKQKSGLHFVVLKCTKAYALIGIYCLLGEIIMGGARHYVIITVIWQSPGLKPLFIGE